MKVLVLRGVLVNGETLDAGSTYDLSEADAEFVIRIGKATVAPTETSKPKPKKPKPYTVKDGSE
jgi:hypothetical protein|tara:strand:+ start:859 stop:1050 length:192 start_codon:yes stop_codon:yes gene_type:complete